MIRLHVNEIRSVKYSRDDESDSETYTIRFPLVVVLALVWLAIHTLTGS